MPSSITLILGGASSGKSEFAEKLLGELDSKSHLQARRGNPFANAVLPANQKFHYVATSQVRLDDAEMQAKIARHQARRVTEWQTHEVPLDLPSKLAELRSSHAPILVECLSMWVNNLMEAEWDIRQAARDLMAISEQSDTPIIFVSLEVGLGIVPDNALARQYRDELGKLNQKIAAIADKVILVVAGQPLYIKGQN